MGNQLPEPPASAAVDHDAASDLERRPDVVLAVLEADQLVSAKEQSRFGRAKLSVATRLALLLLRVYVVLMVALVAAQAILVLHGGR